jgi:hypothetical protein
MKENETNKENTIPENSTTKPMDSKKDVANSNDAKTDQDFPGYPHYPAKDDIMDERTDSHRVDVDVENLPNSKNTTGLNQRFATTGEDEKKRNAMAPQPGSGDDDLGLKPGTDADVNEDDLAALNATDDEIGSPQNVSNEDINTDLDVPGSELDDANEEIGEEDEENNYYSLGGDQHQNLDEDPAGGL